jgi:hypothetical protein
MLTCGGVFIFSQEREEMNTKPLNTIKLFAQMMRQTSQSDLENTFKALSGYQNLEQYIADSRAIRAAMVKTFFTPEIIEGLARQLKPWLGLIAEASRHQSLIGSVFAQPKLRLRLHPTVRRIVDEVRQTRFQTQPQELGTIA